MKKICVQPANEIEILFNDRAYTATFNMEAVMYMQEELGKSGLENISYQHFAAITLYSGIKVNHKDFEMEEAVALVMEDQTGAILRGFEASVGVQKEILEAVLGIQIGDEVLGRAVNRYNRRMAVIQGGF